MGAEGSLEVDVDQFKESMSEGAKFGEDKVVFTVGGARLPAPIAIKLVPLYEALKPVYYTANLTQTLPARCDFSHGTLNSKLSHVTKAFQKYPEMKDAINPTGEQTCGHFESVRAARMLILTTCSLFTYRPRSPHPIHLAQRHIRAGRSQGSTVSKGQTHLAFWKNSSRLRRR